MKLIIVIISLVLVIMLLTSSTGNAQTNSGEEGMKTVEVDKFLEGNTTAPDFPRGLTWFNVENPLSLKQLRGKIVLLDFWTFCCINCMHVIPELKKLEKKYDEDLVVIGVHSAKFTNEKESDAIRQAILRYELEHPVVNDHDFQIWSSYGVSAWPSFVLINPKGKIIGVHSGEDIYEPFDKIISKAVNYFTQTGDLKPGPINLDLERNDLPNTLLSFPGKVKSDPRSKRLVITDSNNDRIIITNLTGKVLEIIGSGENGNRDGDFEQAEFNHPQGTYLMGDILYIADTENHTIRKANLKTRKVVTILGCGKKGVGHDLRKDDGTICLRSPWDVVVNDNVLYIAMAGSHQIWSYNLDNSEANAYAGSGREARIDGDLKQAALAQPSGIVSDGKLLYFADSETSSIRTAQLPPGNKVTTLIGEDLFEYGDIDGHADRARLQHPLGIALYNGKIYIADTYNSKIKVIDPHEMTSKTYAGNGKSGYKDGKLKKAQFYEASGLTVLDDKIYVADENNHAIRVIDMKSEEVSTLNLSGLDKITPTQMANNDARQIALPNAVLKTGQAKLNLSIDLPEGYELTKGAPQMASLVSGNPDVLSFSDGGDKFELAVNGDPLDVVVELHDGMTELVLSAMIYFCKEGSGLCMVDNLQIKMPVTVNGTGKSEIEIPVAIEAKM